MVCEKNHMAGGRGRGQWTGYAPVTLCHCAPLFSPLCREEMALPVSYPVLWTCSRTITTEPVHHRSLHPVAALAPSLGSGMLSARCPGWCTERAGPFRSCCAAAGRCGSLPAGAEVGGHETATCKQHMEKAIAGDRIKNTMH